MLTDIKCRNAAAAGKITKLADSGGLYLWVYSNGSKYWRFRYWQNGKEQSLSLGVYPEIGLKEAREKRDVEKKRLKDGLDPSAERRAVKIKSKLAAETSFEAVAREWIGMQSARWTPRYTSRLTRRVEVDLFPKLGRRPINEIDAQELLAVLRDIERRGAIDIAHRAHQISGQVFAYAIATGRASRNIATDLRGALMPHVSKNNPCLTASELPDFMKALADYGNIQTRLAIKLLMLTMVRTAELRYMERTDLDADNAEWRVPGEKMKMRRVHIVPLSRQALAVIEQLQPYTGQWKYVFPNQHKPQGAMSENTILYALYRMGYKGRTTGHGFRATASTILHENGFNSDWIESQLAHVPSNKVKAAYNHAQYLKERREMMQWWGNYLDSCGLKSI